MRIRGRIAALSCVGVLMAASVVSTHEPLRMQVSPVVSLEPAFVTVRLSVEAAAENRGLLVVAESPNFFRSSEIQIDGENAAPLQVFEFKNLPNGEYEITGILVGTHGTRARISRVAKVVPSAAAR